jgi:hypothetical protein
MEPKPQSTRIRTVQSAWQCDCCPPERVCAWACLQGAGIEDIIIGAALALEGTGGTGMPRPADGAAPALWEVYNTYDRF